MAEEKTFTETIAAKGDQLVEKVETIIRNGLREGNIRQVIIRKANGAELAKFSLTEGAIGAGITLFLAPILALVATVAGLVTDCSVDIVKIQPKTDDGPHITEQTTP